MSVAELPRRKRMRLPNYDYGTAGYYFVTVCTQDNRCVLGTVVGAGLARPVAFPALPWGIREGQAPPLRQQPKKSAGNGRLHKNTSDLPMWWRAAGILP